MTPNEIEELRIAIAEECGWKFKTQEYGDPYWAHPEINRVFDEPPFYTTSLDSIQAAAVERFRTKTYQDVFEIELCRTSLSKKRNNWQLTALDWCLTFARMTKIWRYKV